MKKFAKLAAVFAALVLTLSCFVACSNGNEDSKSPGSDKDKPTVSGTTTPSDSDDNKSVKALQGLWIYEEESYIWGWYFVNNTMYLVQYVDGTYYCIEDQPMSFSVSGNKIIVDEEDDELSFTINGKTMNFTMPDGKSFIMKKVNVTPTKITYSDLEELDNMF